MQSISNGVLFELRRTFQPMSNAAEKQNELAARVEQLEKDVRELADRINRLVHKIGLSTPDY